MTQHNECAIWETIAQQLTSSHGEFWLSTKGSPMLGLKWPSQVQIIAAPTHYSESIKRTNSNGGLEELHAIVYAFALMPCEPLAIAGTYLRWKHRHIVGFEASDPCGKNYPCPHRPSPCVAKFTDALRHRWMNTCGKFGDIAVKSVVHNYSVDNNSRVVPGR